MKKLLISVLLLLVLLLGMTACGEEKGFKIINHLGTELVTLTVTNDGGEELTMYNFTEGESGLYYSGYPKKEGFVNIDGVDAEGNTYHFGQVYIYDEVEVTLRVDSNGDLWAEFFIEEGVMGQYEGKRIPALAEEE